MIKSQFRRIRSLQNFIRRLLSKKRRLLRKFWKGITDPRITDPYPSPTREGSAMRLVCGGN